MLTDESLRAMQLKMYAGSLNDDSIYGVSISDLYNVIDELLSTRETVVNIQELCKESRNYPA